MAELRIFGGSVVLPSSCVGNEQVSSTSIIDADKIEQARKRETGFGLAKTGTPVTRTEVLSLVNTTGSIRRFRARLADTGTSTSLTFDLHKNGVSVLSAPISFTNADPDGTPKEGTISTPTLAADDELSVVLTVTSATGAQGPHAVLEYDEQAS